MKSAVIAICLFISFVIRAEDTNKSLPFAVPVLTAEEAIRANEEALNLYAETVGIAKKKDKSVAGSTKDEPVPMAIPVLSPEEAIKANREAIRIQRNKRVAETFQSFWQKIENNNRIHFIISLLPLLLVFDIFLFKRKKKSNKFAQYVSLSRRIRILLSVSLLAFGILIFVPWSVYFGNSLQFPFIFQDFVNWNLRILTISIVGASIILLLIPAIISDYIVAVVSGLGLCVYVQAMFMNQYLGTMDGLEPEWSAHRVFGTINLIIWIVIVLSPVVLRKAAPSLFSNIISIATGFILFLELLATASMVFSANQNVWSRKDTYFVDGSGQFQLSREKNVILFVMDALGSGCVKNCFEVYPETKEIVKDFIWYVDARSNYQQTFPGLSNELTGAYLQAPAKNYRDMFEKQWNTLAVKSFFKQIKDVGYDARFYIKHSETILGATDCYHDFYSNIQAADITYSIDYIRIHSCLKQMSGFSAAPYFVKKHFFYAFDFADGTVQKKVKNLPPDKNKREIPDTNDGFLKKMISSGISLDADTPVISFHYIHGAHVPWIFDEKCNKVDEPFDNPTPTTKGCFYLLSELIRLLKEAKIYDNTAILLCSDHGGRAYQTPFDMTFMIKPFHENKNEVSIDDSKVQSVDVLPTLLWLACGKDVDFNDFDGYPAFNIPNGRIRKVYKLAENKSFPFFDGWSALSTNCLNEFDFIDVNNIPLVRQIPLVSIDQGDK